jgi:hypothetical protein
MFQGHGVMFESLVIGSWDGVMSSRDGLLAVYLLDTAGCTCRDICKVIM